MRKSTGIPVLDDMLRGGLEDGSTTVLYHTPFINGALFAYHICHHRLKSGDSVIYFTNTKRIFTIMEDAERFGWDMREYREIGRLSFIDAYTPFMGLSGEGRYAVSDPTNPEEITSVLARALEEHESGSLLVIDSLSTALDQCGVEVLDKLEDWGRLVTLYDASLLCVFADWGYESQIRMRIEDFFENMIELTSIERNVIIGDIFTVRKVEGEVVESKRVPFKLMRPGGVRIYIPKILVTGPFHAGKTSVVHALSTRAVSVDRESTTVALDFGHVEFEGFYADLFGTTGQQRFDPILEQLGGEAIAVILVVDSTKPETFPRAIEMLRKARAYGLPCIVFANKQDLPNALSPEEVRAKLGFGEEVPVVGTVATTGEGVREGLRILLNTIFGG
ncbi:MAG TPA: GTP-binding protein [Candidatus Korarchaeota archaeon]|nr:MAG: GTP-binding protein [Candidatus Korarchaeota archaeon]HDD68997.1 GTP-binding protein [Candidatus Korarchaeota archaeon]